MQTDTSQRNKSLWCDYHKDHKHETNRCQSLKFLVKKLIKAGYLRRYIRELDHGVVSGQATNKIIADATIPSESKPAINYIMGSPSHETDKCQSLKFLVKKLIKAGHLKRYIIELNHGVVSGQAANKIIANATIPSESKPVITI